MRGAGALLLALLLSACAAAPLPPATTVDGGLQVTGLYFYEDGDRFRWNCGEDEPCVDSLVRDAELQRRVEMKSTWALTLIVRRVDACGVDSDGATCARGDRTALKILRWIDPPAGH